MKTLIGRIQQYINWGELFFDVVIFLSINFLYELIVAPGKTLLTSYDNKMLLFIIVLIEFIVISYLGSLYRNFGRYLCGISGFFLRVIFFIIINGMFMLMIIAVAVLKILPLSTLGGDAEFIILLILTAPFLMALLTSFDLDDIDDVKYLFYLPATLLFLAVPISSLIIGYRSHWYLGLLAFPVIILILLSPLLIKHLIKRIGLSDENRFFSITKKLWVGLLFPGVVALALVFWHELSFKAIIQTQINNKMPITTSFMVGSLFLSGLIPVRIIAAIEPPYKILNTLISIGVFSYFFWTMIQYIQTL